MFYIFVPLLIKTKLKTMTKIKTTTYQGNTIYTITQDGKFICEVKNNKDKALHLKKYYDNLFNN